MNKPNPPMLPPDQGQQLIEALESIANSLEHLTNIQGVIANSLLQLSDCHGSNTPGPF